jgi:hypothetical protein
MEQGMDAISSLSKVRPYLRKLKRYRRHVSKITNYGTPKKVANIMLAEWELRRQKSGFALPALLLHYRCLQPLQSALPAVPYRQRDGGAKAGYAVA